MTHRNRPALRRHVEAILSLCLGICLTACNDDSGAPHVAVQTPDEGRTGTDDTLNASSARGLGTHHSVASTNAEMTSNEPPTEDAAADTAPELPVVGSCADPISVTCGARMRHDTRLNGQPNELHTYACTARVMSGPETLYLLEDAAGCDVVVRLTDLEANLFAISTSKCEPFADRTCSGPDPDNREVERLMFTASTSERNLLSVDGYEDAAGAYTLEVDCTCPLALDASTN